MHRRSPIKHDPDYSGYVDQYGFTPLTPLLASSHEGFVASEVPRRHPDDVTVA